MRFSNIKIRHIYNVIFDPVRDCEFNGRHLALVLKRNNDNNTFIVMPLTSASNGNGINKIKLNTINSLPSSLRNNETYAVYNQIRTVNASRFIKLKEGQNVIESKIDDETFNNLFKLGIKDIMFNLDQDEKIELLKKLYEEECIAKAISLAYSIIELKKEIEVREKEIESIKQEIKDTLNGIPYKLEQSHVDNGIRDILDDVFRKKDI